MIEYYGHNDYRDYYLSHHGVLGMHWGIRRYQPYGSGGYNPKGDKWKFVGRNKSEPDKRAIRDIKKRLYSSSKKPLTKDEYESVIRDVIGNVVSKDDIKKMHSLEKEYSKTYDKFDKEFKEHEKKHPDLAKLHDDPDMDGSKYWDEMIKKYPNNKLVKLGDKTGELHSEYIDSVEKMADEVGKILETKGLDRLLKKQVYVEGESKPLNSYMVGREVAYRVRDDKNILKSVKENTQDDLVSSLMKDMGVDVKNINRSPLTNKEILAYKKLRKDYNNLLDEYDKKYEKYKRGEISHDEIRKIEDRIDLKEIEAMEFQDDLRQKYVR